MGVHEICRWGSCTYTTTNNMFDVMRDLTRVGVDPVQTVIPPNILVNIPQPAPLNDVLYKLGYDTIDFCIYANERGCPRPLDSC